MRESASDGVTGFETDPPDWRHLGCRRLASIRQLATG